MEEDKNQQNGQKMGEAQERQTYEGNGFSYQVENKPILSPEGYEKPVSMKQWLLFWAVGLINVIPFIGSLAYIVFIFYVALAKNPKFPVSMQNFCKAYLILIAIGIVIGVVFMGSMIAMMGPILGGGMY